MSKLRVCVCPRCEANFGVSQSTVEEVREITCPVCEQRFDPREDKDELLEDEEGFEDF